ncbi:MAG: M48 family metallopeptidase [Nocardia sp.]|nr:M48 family metallopeptidase [Nocardia sp.]
MTGWDPKTGPPGWTRQQPFTPPAIPPHDRTRGLGPWGMPARHSWENPLLAVVVALTVIGYAVSLLVTLLGVVNSYLMLVVLAPLVLWFGRGTTYSAQRLNAVKMSPTQFPEGYRMVVEAAGRFGMAKVPDAYVVLGNGQINAFASGHGFRRFVAIHSDLFEVGGAARDPDALAFIIGHEVGHIAAGHVSYWRQFGMTLGNVIPLLGNSLSRAQEYTADNHGFCFRSGGAPGAMQVLAAGKYLNALVGVDELADRAPQEKGFFIWVVNAMSSHPVMTWRTWALRDRSRHGRLFLRPSMPRPSGQNPAAPYPPGPVPPPYPQLPQQYSPQPPQQYPQGPLPYQQGPPPYQQAPQPNPQAGSPYGSGRHNPPYTGLPMGVAPATDPPRAVPPANPAANGDATGPEQDPGSH